MNHKTTLLLLFPLAMIPSMGHAQTNTWTKKASIGPTLLGRGHAVGFAIGSKGYVGLGSTLSNMKDLWEFNPTSNTWSRKTDFPGTGAADATVFSIGTKGYVCAAGVLPGDGLHLWEYDPLTNAWTRKADINVGLVDQFGATLTSLREAVSFSIGNKGYVGTGSGFFSEPGGGRGILIKKFWEFDPSSNTWTQKADAAFSTAQASAFAIGSNGYLVVSDSPVNSFTQFSSISNSWTNKAPFSGVLRNDAVGFSIGTKGYYGTGVSLANPPQKLGDFWEYDPATNAWTQKANVGGGARSSAVGFSIGTKGYVGTGLDAAGTRIQDFWEYSPTANTWTRKADVGERTRVLAAGFNIGNTGYVGTGSMGADVLDDFWAYDPIADTWAQKARFLGGARRGAVGIGIGTKGYLGTGADASGALKQDFWQYDPAANAWVQKANFGGNARQNAVAFSILAKGYVCTGVDGLGELKKDLWEYDQATNTWSQKADLAGAGRKWAVAFSIGPKGYVGTGSTGSQVKDFYEYDPGTNVWTRKADFAGAARNSAVGFASGTKGYIAAGVAQGTLEDTWEYDPINNTWTGKAGLIGFPRNGAIAFGLGSKGYMGMATVEGGEQDLWEYTPSSGCTANAVTVTITTDGSASQTSWDIVMATGNSPVVNGFGYANSSTTNIAGCLLAGSYDLRVFDSGNNGMGSGGFMLRDGNNKRIVDNVGNGASFTSLSQAAVSFSLPLGNNELTVASCDQEQLSTNSVIQAVIDPLVSAQVTASAATSGYQFQFFDPSGGYSRNIFQSHAAPGIGFPASAPAAEKCAYVKLTSVSGAPSPLPLNKLLNVRVRARINGVDKNFGPACRMKVVS